MQKRIIILLFITNSLLFFFQMISKSVYIPLVTPFQQVFNVGATKAGLLITLAFSGYALSRFPSGIITDVLGCEKTIIIGSFMTGSTILLVGFANNYFSLAFLTFIIGVASGIYITAGYTYAVRIGKSNKETTSTALLEFSGGFAGLVAPLLVVLFLEDWQISWRGIFFSIGAGFIITNLLFIWLKKLKQNNKKKISDNKDNKKKISSGLFKKEALKALYIFKKPEMRRFIIWATLVGGFGNFAILGFKSFIPSYLYEYKGYEFSTANQLFMIVAISGLITKIIIGWLADKIGIKKILFGILCLNFLLFISFTSTINHVLIILTLALFGMTSINHNTLINAYVLKLIPDKHKGTGFGLFSTLYTIIYSMGPVVTGIINDRFGMTFGMRAAIIGLIIAGFLLWYHKKIAGKNI